MKVHGCLKEIHLKAYAKMLVRRKYSPIKMIWVSLFTIIFMGIIALTPLLFAENVLFYFWSWVVWLPIGFGLLYFWIPKVMFKTVRTRLEKLGAQLEFTFLWDEKSLHYNQNGVSQIFEWSNLLDTWELDGLWLLRFEFHQLAIPNELLEKAQTDFLKNKCQNPKWLAGLDH